MSFDLLIGKVKIICNVPEAKLVPESKGGAGGETGARVEAGAEGKAGAGGEVRFKNLDVTLEKIFKRISRP